MPIDRLSLLDLEINLRDMQSQVQISTNEHDSWVGFYDPEALADVIAEALAFRQMGYPVRPARVKVTEQPRDVCRLPMPRVGPDGRPGPMPGMVEAPRQPGRVPGSERY